MAMGTRRPPSPSLWIDAQALAKGPGHPFYSRLSKLLKNYDFDRFVEKPQEPCIGANYAPFPELQRLSR